MFPFSTSIVEILNQHELDEKIQKDIARGLLISKKEDHFFIKQFHEMAWNRSLVSYCSSRQSTSHLPVSIRKDRFKDGCGYCQMYTYNGLIDNKHYQSIKRILKRINDWNFNVFALERFSSGFPLTYLAMDIFESHDLINLFQLDISHLFQFFMIIERSYHQSNPYHNAIHAADVTQAINCIIHDKQIWKQLSNVDVLCSLISTICHDVDHPGLNNLFLNNSNHHLSILYKKESVLENHHWAFSLSVLKETNLFAHFSKSLWTTVTDTCGSLIKATDISKQKVYIDCFNKRFIDENATAESHTLNDEEKLLVLQMAIKCADICNPCRRWDICNCWAYLVTEEFFQQGDRERILSLPVTPMMDRNISKLAVIQKDFIRFLVQPLFSVWDKFTNSPLSKQFMATIDTNEKMWQQLADFPASESESIILSSLHSLYDKLQLMQVMDYTEGHQLSHLQQLIIESKIKRKSQKSSLTSLQDSIEMDECLHNFQNTSFGLYNVSEIDDDAKCKTYHQARRGSLPITLQSNLKEYSCSISARKNILNQRSSKMMVRRTSLQTGQGYTTSLMTTSIQRIKNSSNNCALFGPSQVNTDNPKFPTANRRKSAPAIKANPIVLLETIHQGRRGSLSGYVCSKLRSSGLCSSQSHLNHHAHSLNDIQIPQVG